MVFRRDRFIASSVGLGGGTRGQRFDVVTCAPPPHPSDAMNWSLRNNVEVTYSATLCMSVPYTKQKYNLEKEKMQ
jgi:hypothetical protein